MTNFRVEKEEGLAHESPAVLTTPAINLNPPGDLDATILARVALNPLPLEEPQAHESLLTANKETQSHIGVPILREHLTHTISIGGEERLTEWLNNPLRDPVAIAKRNRQLQYLIDNPKQRKNLSEYLRSTQRLHHIDLEIVKQFDWDKRWLSGPSRSKENRGPQIARIDKLFPTLEEEYEIRKLLGTTTMRDKARGEKLATQLGYDISSDLGLGKSISALQDAATEEPAVILFEAKRLKNTRDHALIELDDLEEPRLRSLLNDLSPLRLSVVEENWEVPQLSGTDSIPVPLSQAKQNHIEDGCHPTLGNHPINEIEQRVADYQRRAIRIAMHTGAAIGALGAAIPCSIYMHSPGDIWLAGLMTIFGGVFGGMAGHIVGLCCSAPRSFLPSASGIRAHERPKGAVIDLEELKQQQEAFAELDALVTLAEGLAPYKDKLCRAKFGSEQNGMRASRARPPLLLLKGNAAEPVDFDLTFDEGLFLTGSNSGGKSQTIKSAGLNQWIAQVTGFAFAESFETEIFDGIACLLPQVTDENDLTNPAGRFKREGISARDVLDEVLARNGKTLVLWDEWGQGANPEDSQYVTELISAGIVRAGGLLVMATQLLDSSKKLVEEGYELIPGETVRFRGLQTVNTPSGVPTYQFEEGVATSTNARIILDDIGINKETITRKIHRRELERS